MKTPEEKRWEKMHQFIVADASGETPVKVSSTRTLFGIKSHVEKVIDEVVAEDVQKCTDNLNSEN